jgi:glycerol-3-phosphate acyltransferase PlsY
MQLLNMVFILLLSYLLGSIPNGLIVVKIGTGKDVRWFGSGRTGGTNAMRAGGLIAGLITGLLDVVKGAATMFLVAWLMPGNVWVQVAAALMAIIGHNYSLFLIRLDPGGKVTLGGGAGGAPCLGGAIALWPPIFLIILPFVALVFVGIGYASITTMSIAFLATIIFAVRAWIGAPGASWVYVGYGVIAEILLLWALRPNLKRLKEGTERAVGLRAYFQSKGKKNLESASATKPARRQLKIGRKPVNSAAK